MKVDRRGMPSHESIRDGIEAIVSDVRMLASLVEHSPLGMSLTPVDRSQPMRLDPRTFW
jgi:hypothetical protein